MSLKIPVDLGKQQQLCSPDRPDWHLFSESGKSRRLVIFGQLGETVLCVHFSAMRLDTSTCCTLSTSSQGDKDILAQNLKAEPLAFILLLKKSFLQ